MIMEGNKSMKQRSFFSLAESPDVKKEQDHPAKSHTKKHSKLAGFLMARSPSLQAGCHRRPEEPLCSCFSDWSPKEYPPHSVYMF